ncbi:hypothetical protein RKS58_11240 [Lysinibacillus capsici]|uniref:hypothetical protein n=1 Tax=Lysinibacillus TaxID=400634 RepID=UPI001C8BFE6C|nr:MULTISPECIES: hypothetical protein [Lysinibacillus]MBX8945585.1 hypothetical protein [Lysinibacillus sp. K60]MED3798609.1 hypothetical protein [Lysinibacillus capsici]WNN78385.1 hypothetical protein RKS58_11240 [Lysinibacillus capsici]
MSEQHSKYNDSRLVTIDEQICTLLQQRKEQAALTPGLPSDDTISKWAQQYGFDDTFLALFFQLIKSEKYYTSKVEPSGFRHYIPVLKTVTKGERLYTVSYVRQYDNASVVQLLIDWDEQQEPQLTIQQKLERKHFGLYIDASYECRSKGTGGSNGHESSTYVVTPPLPDDLRGLHFVFTEYEDAFEEKPTGWAITIQG